MKRKRYWLAAASVIALAVVGIIRARGVMVMTTTVAREPLEQHVVASGRVMPPARINVATNVAGLVLIAAPVEGQHVKRGDLLVQIDDAEARAQVAQARAAVQQASAKVEQLRRVGAIVASQGLNQAQANLDKAQADLERTKRLVETRALAPLELDEAQRALDVARAQKNAAEAQQLGSSPVGADSRVALSALLQAQAQLGGADVRLAQTRIVAAQDGVVLTRNVEIGDTAQPGRVLMTMAADGDVELVFQPDERNLATIALGQHAKASADAFAQDVFDAEVSYIAPSIDPARGTIEVRLRVPKPAAFLKPDMTVSIDLTVASKSDALVVRSDAVRGLATPTPWVLVALGGHAQRREVKVGIQGEGALEITAGLHAGEEVILASAVARAGQRVRTERVER